ncbi:MAG: transglutaminase domain-containing protein [Chloroflexota bacterium]|nr:transglutaminase domain-containing protein [Chloroflexota bacterium]
MSEASVERLSKLISDRPEEQLRRGNQQYRKSTPLKFRLGLAEGWFSLFLLMTVVYSTIWSVQVVAWVPNLGVLTLTTVVGLICGVVAAKQRRFPRLPVHLLAIAFGLLLAFWQTAGADYAGNNAQLLTAIHLWTATALSGGSSGDNSIFLLFITALGFLLAYTSAWLVYRTRSPWLMIVANAIVLLINLSNVAAGYLIFLVVFLLASMLLLLRFNLYESTQRWRRLGLRYANDLGWDFMQAGLLISIGILILSWILPFGYTNNYTSQIWNANANPWTQVENTWNRLIAVSGGTNPSNRGNFTDTLVLGGNPNLNNDIVFTFSSDEVSSDEKGLYLGARSYGTYNGHGWTGSPTNSNAQNKNDNYGSEAALYHPVKQYVTVVNPPGEQYPYIFGASQIASVDEAAVVLVSKNDGSMISWLRGNGQKLAAGDHYVVTSDVSSADPKTLESVPMPDQAPPYVSSGEQDPPVIAYNPAILATYTQLPSHLDPAILTVAERVTKNATTMYDKVSALEEYLRTFHYSTDVHLPPGEEATSWLLFRSGGHAYCTYFATAMAVMARELGLPARVVSGYTHGTFDERTREWVVRGTDAHSWTQVYFAGYGWVNFEPSPSFDAFSRPLPGEFNSTGSGSGTGNKTKQNGSANGHGFVTIPPGEVGGNGSTNVGQAQNQLGQSVGFTLGSIVLLILFSAMLVSIWWRRLFRRYRVSEQIYGRLCLLANWAGIPMRLSDTPGEHIHALALVTPEQAVPLERFGDIYVRELWADPASSEHPTRSGEIHELPGLWKQLQPRLFAYLFRHPRFLRWLPERVGVFLSARASRLRNRQEEDVAPFDGQEAFDNRVPFDEQIERL